MAEGAVAVDPAVPMEDPFVVLGVERTASDDEIKSAYRKLALKYHPDKNPGNAEAQDTFSKVQASWTILSNPELRRRYEAGGMDAIDEAALQEGIQVDVTQMGFMGSALMAMFRKVGHPVKTVVPKEILEQVASGFVAGKELAWGVPAKGRVGNGQAVFYTLDVNTEAIERGFVVHASCVHARVKLLIWDHAPDGTWSMAAQEDAMKLRDSNVACLFHTGGDTLEGVPKSVAQHLQQAAVMDRTQGNKEHDPLAAIFRVLDHVKPRDRLTLKPGTHLIALVGDNFFKKSTFSVQANMLPSPEARQHLETTERAIVEERSELLAFEKDFKRVRAEFEAAVVKLEAHSQTLDKLFVQQEAAYCSMLGLPIPEAASGAAGAKAMSQLPGDRASTSMPETDVDTPARSEGTGVLKSLNATFRGLFGNKREKAV